MFCLDNVIGGTRYKRAKKRFKYLIVNGNKHSFRCKFKFQIDPGVQAFLREGNTPAGLSSARLLIYVKRKPFCRSIRRELQLFEVGALPLLGSS